MGRGGVGVLAAELVLGVLYWVGVVRMGVEWGNGCDLGNWGLSGVEGGGCKEAKGWLVDRTGISLLRVLVVSRGGQVGLSQYVSGGLLWLDGVGRRFRGVGGRFLGGGSFLTVASLVISRGNFSKSDQTTIAKRIRGWLMDRGIADSETSLKGSYEKRESFFMDIWLHGIDGEKEDELATLYLAFGRHLEEIHVNWAHLEKKRTRLRTYNNISQDYVLSGWRRRHKIHVTPS
ncbi:hypothetical protein Tco_1197490 [Tanacetum coccineum]